jgi:hypothetical protein
MVKVVDTLDLGSNTFWYKRSSRFRRIFLYFTTSNLFFLMFSLYTQRHAFHLVDPSILPFITSISALSLTLGSVLYFHGYNGGLESTLFGLCGVLTCMFL